jgi:hypothetical protein
MAFATKTQHLSRTKIETKAGPAMIRLPRDHAAHNTNPNAGYWERWRFAAGGNDQNTGDPYTLDFEYSLRGYDPETQRPLVQSIFHLHSLSTGLSCSTEVCWHGPLLTEGSSARTSAKNFWVRYIVGTPQAGGGLWAFRAKEENWRFRAINRMTTEPQSEEKSVITALAFDLDLLLKTLAPGWKSRAPSENAPSKERPEASTSSRAGYDLSYFELAAQMAVSGKVSCSRFQIDFEGRANFEHQWGAAGGDAYPT